METNIKPNFIQLNHLENQHSPKIKFCEFFKCGNKIVKDSTYWWKKCNKCFTWNCFFYPTKQQEVFMNDNKRVVILLGSTNSGKTDPCVFKLVKYVMSNPHSQIMIIGPSRKRIHDILDEKLRDFIPLEWVAKNKHRNYQWNDSKIVFLNGSVFQFFASNDIDDIKGSSINKAYILEASAIKQEVLEEIYGRMRNKTAIEYAYDKNGEFIIDKNTGRKKVIKDHTQIIFDSNPESHPYLENLSYKVSTFYYCISFQKTLEKIKHKFCNTDNFFSLHHFNVEDNIHSTEEYIELVKKWTGKKKRINYIGWFYQSDDFIYANTYIKGILPEVYKPKKEDIGFYITGFDPGYSKASAYMLGCWDKKLKCYILYRTMKLYRTDIINVINQIKNFERNNCEKNIRIKRTGDPVIRDLSIQGQLLSLLNKNNLTFYIPKYVNFDWTVKKVISMVEKNKLKYCPSLVDFFEEKKNYREKKTELEIKKAKYAIGVDDLLDCERYIVNLLKIEGEEKEPIYKDNKNIDIKRLHKGFFLNRHLE